MWFYLSLDWLGALLIIILNVVDPVAHRIAAHHTRVEWLQQLGHHGGVFHPRIELEIVTTRLKNHWHAVVNGGGHWVWSRSQDRAGLDPSAVRIFPAFPQSSECEELAFVYFEAIWLLDIP